MMMTNLIKLMQDEKILGADEASALMEGGAGLYYFPRPSNQREAYAISLADLAPVVRRACALLGLSSLEELVHRTNPITVTREHRKDTTFFTYADGVDTALFRVVTYGTF